MLLEKALPLNYFSKKSIDGDTAEDFHKYCDNQGKTLIIIETDEGRKFGGFTNDSWNTDDKWRKNKNDFVFSLDLNKKYCNNGGDSTVSCKSEGPVFGYRRWEEVDIYFGPNLNNGKSNTSNTQSFHTNYELNNGKEDFKTKELKVYKVIIN